MRHDDGRRREPLVQVDDEPVDRHRRHGIEARRRLVVEEDLGLERDGAGQGDALLHAARERGGKQALHVASEVDEPEHLRDAGRDLLLRPGRVLAQREGDVLEDRHRVEEGAALEEHADLLAHGDELLLGKLGDLHAVHPDLAVVGLLEAVHVPERDGLARAGSAEDHEHLAAHHLEVHVVEHALLAVGLGDVLELDDRSARGVGRPDEAHDGGLAERHWNPSGRTRKSFVRKKSDMRTAIEATTTAIVVARPTPSAPPDAFRPL